MIRTIIFVIIFLMVNSYIPTQDIKEEIPLVDSVILREVKKYDDRINFNIIKAVIHVESSNIKNAVSYKGAVGLMQISRLCRIHYNWIHGTTIKRSDLFNEEINITIGIWYLSYCLDYTGGMKLALTGYFWGCWNERKTPRYANKVLKKYLAFNREDIENGRIKSSKT